MSRASNLYARTPLDALLGPPAARRSQRAERRLRDQPLAVALETVAERCGGELADPEEEPLFIFSAGWRSGSTLLQRLINSSGTYLLWGEPYARSELVARLADSLRPISSAWPAAEDVVASGERWNPADRWTANLHPPLPALVESHRAFFRTLLGSELNATGSPQWGFKEVRLEAEYALYLRFLFPRAKFVFLVRNPLDAFASYKSWRNWYWRWPDGQVRTASAYGRMWRTLAQSYAETHQAVGAVLLRYEDLVVGNPAIGRLEALLGSPVDQSVLERRISGSSRSASAGAVERFLIGRQAGATARSFGY